MGEDKLTHAERIRLESLARAEAIALHFIARAPSVEQLLELAEQIETWLKKAREDA